MDIFNRFLYNFVEGGLIVGIVLFIIDILRISNPTLLPYFGFISASFFLIQLYQFHYIKTTAKKYTMSFLYHSIYGYLILLIMSILLYLVYYHSNIKNIIIIFFILNILIWVIYIWCILNPLILNFINIIKMI